MIHGHERREPPKFSEMAPSCHPFLWAYIHQAAPESQRSECMGQSVVPQKDGRGITNLDSSSAMGKKKKGADTLVWELKCKSWLS